MVGQLDYKMRCISIKLCEFPTKGWMLVAVYGFDAESILLGNFMYITTYTKIVLKTKEFKTFFLYIIDVKQWELLF